MMKPVIVSYDCSDIDNVECWKPADRSDVDFWMNFTIGPDSTAGDNYQVHVVTPKALNNNPNKKHSVVLNYYDWQALLKEIDNILEQCQGQDWQEMSEKLSKFLYWEFEGYQPYHG